MTQQVSSTLRVPQGRNTLGGVIRSEWIKLMSLRSMRLTLLLTFLAGVGIAALGAIVMSQFMPDIVGEQASADYLLQTLQPPIMFLGLLFGVLGVFAISSEYSSGMILSTLAATPKRGRVFTAKFIVVTVISFATAVLTLGVGQLIAVVVTPGAVSALGNTQYLTAWAGAVIFLVAMTLLAFGIAGLLRSTAGGIAVIAGLTFVAPIALSFASMAGKEWIDWLMNHLPLMLGNTLSAGVTDVPAEYTGMMMGWGEAAISMVGWALIAVVPAWLLFIKRDAK